MAPPERPPRAPRPDSSRSGPPRRGPAGNAGGKPPFRRREDEEQKKPYRARQSDAGGTRKPYQRRDDRPATGGSSRSYQRRDDAGGERKPYQRRDAGTGGERKPYQRRDDRPAGAAGERKPYQRRDDRPAGAGERKPFQRRDDRATGSGGERKPYQRRDSAPSGERRPYQGRSDRPTGAGPGGERKPYQRRDDAAGPRRSFDRREEPAPVAKPTPKGWGGVTRRGARQVTDPTALTDEAKAYEKRVGSPKPKAVRPEVDSWDRSERTQAPPRAPKKTPAKGRPIRSKSLPADVVAEVASASGNNRRAPMLQKRLGEAARHVQHGRDREAVAILRPLAQEVPEAASVRELYAQALYGLGRYRAAAPEFEAFIELTASTDQHPMLADCYRALGRHKKVQELWADLKESSPTPDIVAEGRIVTAGSLADQGKLPEAIALLEASPPVRGRVAERHLRTWFALADLYERSGELSKSRALFQRVQAADPEFVDVAERLHGLG